MAANFTNVKTGCEGDDLVGLGGGKQLEQIENTMQGRLFAWTWRLPIISLPKSLLVPMPYQDFINQISEPWRVIITRRGRGSIASDLKFNGGCLCGLEVDTSGVKTLKRILMPECVPNFGMLFLCLCPLVLAFACLCLFTIMNLTTICERSPFGGVGGDLNFLSICLPPPYQHVRGTISGLLAVAYHFFTTCLPPLQALLHVQN